MGIMGAALSRMGAKLGTEKMKKQSAQRRKKVGKAIGAGAKAMLESRNSQKAKRNRPQRRTQVASRGRGSSGGSYPSRRTRQAGRCLLYTSPSPRDKF